MKEWKALLSINLSLALLLGAICPAAYAEEAPADVLPVEESVPVEIEGDPYPAEEAESETEEPELARRRRRSYLPRKKRTGKRRFPGSCRRNRRRKRSCRS